MLSRVSFQAYSGGSRVTTRAYLPEYCHENLVPEYLRAYALLEHRIYSGGSRVTIREHLPEYYHTREPLYTEVSVQRTLSKPTKYYHKNLVLEYIIYSDGTLTPTRIHLPEYDNNQN